jgi:hypothetical protein
MFAVVVVVFTSFACSRNSLEQLLLSRGATRDSSVGLLELKRIDTVTVVELGLRKKHVAGAKRSNILNIRTQPGSKVMQQFAVSYPHYLPRGASPGSDYRDPIDWRANFIKLTSASAMLEPDDKTIDELDSRFSGSGASPASLYDTYWMKSEFAWAVGPTAQFVGYRRASDSKPALLDQSNWANAGFWDQLKELIRSLAGRPHASSSGWLTATRDMLYAMSPCGRLATIRCGWRGDLGSLWIYSTGATTLLQRQWPARDFVFDGDLVITPYGEWLDLLDCARDVEDKIKLTPPITESRPAAVLVPELSELWLTDERTTVWRYPWRVTPRRYSDEQILRSSAIVASILGGLGVGILLLGRVLAWARPNAIIAHIPLVKSRWTMLAALILCLVAALVYIQRNSLIGIL